MRIQLWSYNYDPEPTGIAPLSTLWARGMAERGHDVTVVAAHPHYPEPAWGGAARPYRERRDGIPVIRLPLKVGRSSSRERLVQELSFVDITGGDKSPPPAGGRDRRGVAVVPRAGAGDGDGSASPGPMDPLAAGHPSRRRGGDGHPRPGEPRDPCRAAASSARHIAPRADRGHLPQLRGQPPSQGRAGGEDRSDLQHRLAPGS